MSDDLDFGQTIRGLVGGQFVFGRFRLERMLGRGGMGVVWLARDERLEEEVALKFLPETVRMDSTAVDELKRETRKSRRLTHAGIVRIHDFVEDATGAAIAMEYISGQTLAEKRLEKPCRAFEPEDIRDWMIEVCEALGYAHREAKIVHRDLKPANIMVSGSGHIKITDFGIARSISDSMSRVSIQRPGTSGSPPYMSPQQVMGEPSQPADDIYSMGATIYELLTGKPPFYSGNIYAQIKDKVPPPMAQRRMELGVTGCGEIPLTWEAVVARCLAKDPALRPQSARQMLEWLEGRKAVPGREEPKIAATPRKFPAKLPPLIEEQPRKQWDMDSILSFLGLVGVVGGALVLIVCSQIVLPGPTPVASATPIPIPTGAAVTAPRPVPPPARAVLASPAPALTLALTAPAHIMDDIPAPTAAPSVRPVDVVALATKEKPFTNSLGMKFVPIPGTGVLFSVWDTRVRDFRAYAEATGYQQRGGIGVLKVVKNNKTGGYSTSWEVDKEASWEAPGFKQTWDDPVVGVSWDDAKAFCEWLTEKDRKEGKIGNDHEYRLPTDEEWSAAVGESKYPWGIKWPPPGGSGNYFDDAAVAKLPGKGWPQVPGNDGYARTSPVGSFKANRLGLYDIGGNVWQWCEDWFRADMNEKAVLEKLPALKNDGGGHAARVLRGGSWANPIREYLSSSTRASNSPNSRESLSGFRCVLVRGPSR